MNEIQSFPLVLKKVVVTGKLQNYTRHTVIQMLREKGALPTHKVSGQTNYLIVGTHPGSKLEKARSLGVCILSEADFESMLSV